jgi:NTE family protein
MAVAKEASARTRLCLLGLLCLPIGALCQPRGADQAESAPRRPTIGLVLSGGGARGGAHIGVLKALEELRVPVDFIAGTSVGAVIGGLYASGMSVEQLDETLRSTDWEAAFLNRTPRKLEIYRRKRDDDLFLVRQKPGLTKGEFLLPAGLVQGQVMDEVLSRLTLPVIGVRDFDRLPIPFRAVATDTATGKADVLGSGNLALAIRASMTLPAAIAPVEIGGHQLIDGGIAMNLPVEVAQAMGADIIIAVDLTAPLRSRKQLTSVLDITTQLTNFLTRGGLEQQLRKLGPDDILLRPKLDQEFSSVSFTRMAETIPAGYEVVMEHRAQLERLSLDPQSYAAYRAARPDPEDAPPPKIDFLRLNNNSKIANRVLDRYLREIPLDEPFDRETLPTVERVVNEIYGMELFQNVRYDLVSEASRQGLELKVEERSWGPNYLQLGMQYSSSTHQNALFALDASYLGTELNKLGGEWRATLTVGDEPAASVDLYQPFGPNAWFFVSPSLRVGSRLLNVYEGERISSEVQLRETTFELGLGRELDTWGEARFGFRRGVGDTRVRVGDPGGLMNEDFRTGEFFARFSVDTLDDIAFPRSGVLARLEWRGSRPSTLSADVRYDQLLMSAVYAKSRGRHTMLATLRYDSTISGRSPLQSLFRLGGFLDLSGFNHNQLYGQHVLRLGGSFYRRIGDLALFPAFAGVSIELGNAWDERADIGLGNMVVGGSIWGGVDSPVGPVYVGYGRAEGGADAFYVSLGRVF